METLISQPQYLILADVTIAMLLAALIGLERELVRKPAGLRTHMLVAGAAALFTGLGFVVIAEANQLFDPNIIRIDPNRIMEAIITGISFLGAGTIIRNQSSEGVEGLTTAASILVAAGIGMAVGLSQYALASGITLIALIILQGVAFIERWMDKRHLRIEEDAEAQQSKTKPQNQGQPSTGL